MIRLATAADAPRILAGANPLWKWNDAIVGARLRECVTHIDEATGAWIQSQPEPDGSYMMWANPVPLSVLPDLMAEHAASFPPGTVCFGEVTGLQRMVRYLDKMGYSRTVKADGTVRYESTMGHMATVARTAVP